MPRFDEIDAEGRLLVTELESVGFVSSGANGPSDILITKKVDSPVPESGKSFWRRVLAKVKGESGEVDKARNAGEFLESQLHAAFTMQADDLFGQGFLSREERITLSTAVGAALDAFRDTVEEKAPHLYERDPFDGPPAVTEGAADTMPKEGKKDRSTTEEVPMAEPITLDAELLAELPEDVQKAFQSNADYIEQLEQERDEAVSKGGDDASADAPKEDILKDAAPEIRELVSKAQAEAEAARTEAAEANETAKAEREMRLNEESLVKAQETPLVADPEDFAPMLRKIEDALDETEVEKFHEILRSAQDRIETGAIYDELGRVGNDPTSKNSAEAQASAKAKELAASKNITYEVAYAEVLKSDKDLQERLYAESRDTARGGAS